MKHNTTFEVLSQVHTQQSETVEGRYLKFGTDDDDKK